MTYTYNRSLVDLCGYDVEQFLEDYDAHRQKDRDTLHLSSKIIAPVGLLLNFVFLFIVVRVKSMRTPINVYLANLMMADTLLLAGFVVSREIKTPHWYNVRVIMSGVYATLRTVSYLLVVAIAVERFSAVYHPVKHRASASNARAAKISAGLWLLAVGIGVIGVFSIKPEFGSDVVIPVMFFLAMTGSISLIAMAVTSSMYICLVLKLRQRSPVSQHHPQRVSKVTCMLIINTAVFFS